MKDFFASPLGAIGLGATVWPFIDQIKASTEVDLSQIQPEVQ